VDDNPLQLRATSAREQQSSQQYSEVRRGETYDQENTLHDGRARISGGAIAACAFVTAFGFAASSPDLARVTDHYEFRLPDHTNPGEMMSYIAQWFADNVTKRSNGRTMIKHFSSSTLGTGSALVQGAQNDSVDMINEDASVFVQINQQRRTDAAAALERRYGVLLNPAYSRLPYGPDAKRSLIAKAALAKPGAKAVSFLPVMIDRQLRPEILYATDPRDRVYGLVSGGFDHTFKIAADEVMVRFRAA
jgi:hypothetical protein